MSVNGFGERISGWVRGAWCLRSSYECLRTSGKERDLNGGASNRSGFRLRRTGGCQRIGGADKRIGHIANEDEWCVAESVSWGKVERRQIFRSSG
jgi:hypothetical protein